LQRDVLQFKLPLVQFEQPGEITELRPVLGRRAASPR
jgi:hypothetical protein